MRRTDARLAQTGARAGLGLVAASLCISAAPEEPGGDITITVTNMRSQEGEVRACMTVNEDIFPKCRKDPDSYRKVVPAKGEVTIRFNNVRPGKYAIGLLHDENADGKANRALGMMPKEGYGFSRDAPVSLGPPDFEDAVFDHGSKDQQLSIKMRYFL